MDGDDATRKFNTAYASNAVFDGKTTPPFAAVWSSTAADLGAKALPRTTLHKKSAGADVDGYCREEICVLYLTSYTPTGASAASHDLVLDIYDGTPSIATRIKQLTLATFADAEVTKFYPNDAVWNASLDLVAGPTPISCGSVTLSSGSVAVSDGDRLGGMCLFDDCVATGQFNGAAAPDSSADACQDLAFLSADCGNLIVCSWSGPGGAMTVSNVDTSDGCLGYYPCLVGAGSDRTVGMSAGVSFGYTTGIPTYAEVSFTASITAGFDYNWGSSYQVSVSKTFKADAEDKVIFSSIPYDVYYYEVLSSPNAGAGKMIAVSIPRSQIITSVEVGFYNANNGACQDVTTDNLITHTIGNPKSYPRPQFVLDRIADKTMFIYNDDGNIHPGNGLTAMQVGQGGGYQQITLSYSSTSSSTKAWDIAVEVKVGMKAGGYTMDASVGFHYGESYAVTSGTDTEFTGAIGNISAADTAAGKGFPFSLFVYSKTLENTSDKVLVLEYCYEGN